MPDRPIAPGAGSPVGPVRGTRRAPSEGGFTLVDVLGGITFLAVALLALASMTTVSMSTQRLTEETVRASTAARAALESLDDGEVPFPLLFAAYVPTPATPLPEGTVVPSRSRSFDVPGLEPQRGDPDGRVGEIRFPTVQAETGTALSEDAAGRDLNGDGAVDGLDHSADYRLLPVTVVVRWTGAAGARDFTLQTLLTAR